MKDKKVTPSLNVLFTCLVLVRPSLVRMIGASGQWQYCFIVPSHSASNHYLAKELLIHSDSTSTIYYLHHFPIPITMEASPQLSPFMAPNKSQKDQELLFSKDPKFALHGEIMMLVLVLVFALFLAFLVFFFYIKRHHGQPATKLGQPELDLSVPVKIAAYQSAEKWRIRAISLVFISSMRTALCDWSWSWSHAA